jgi:cytoskeletal protein CcmA (bactofilin family)
MSSKGNGVTYISAETVLEGEMRLAHPALVAGKFKGKIASTEQIQIELGGEIEGAVQCQELKVLGCFKGQLSCDKLIIVSSGMVEGEVTCKQMEIFEGGQFIGQRLKGPEPMPEPLYETSAESMASSSLESQPRPMSPLEIKPEPKPMSPLEIKPEPKAMSPLEIKPEPKPLSPLEVKPEPKQLSPLEIKPEPKPQSQPDTRAKDEAIVMGMKAASTPSYVPEAVILESQLKPKAVPAPGAKGKGAGLAISGTIVAVAIAAVLYFNPALTRDLVAGFSPLAGSQETTQAPDALPVQKQPAPAVAAASLTIAVAKDAKVEETQVSADATLAVVDEAGEDLQAMEQGHQALQQASQADPVTKMEDETSSAVQPVAGEPLPEQTASAQATEEKQL